MSEPIAIFDCLEFTPRFRRGDVAAEVAFLAMDLEFNGPLDPARVFLDRSVVASGDEEFRALLPFYISHRAVVRRKVESIKRDEPEFTDEERTVATCRARQYVD